MSRETLAAAQSHAVYGLAHIIEPLGIAFPSNKFKVTGMLLDGVRLDLCEASQASASPPGQGQGNAVGTRDECHGPADARSPAQCAWKQCGNLKYRPNLCPPAFPHEDFLPHWFRSQVYFFTGESCQRKRATDKFTV
jgi:hypothetical protein